MRGTVDKKQTNKETDKVSSELLFMTVQEEEKIPGAPQWLVMACKLCSGVFVIPGKIRRLQ